VITGRHRRAADHQFLAWKGQPTVLVAAVAQSLAAQTPFGCLPLQCREEVGRVIAVHVGVAAAVAADGGDFGVGDDADDDHHHDCDHVRAGVSVNAHCSAGALWTGTTWAANSADLSRCFSTSAR
jgi:hypothetical protein